MEQTENSESRGASSCRQPCRNPPKLGLLSKKLLDFASLGLFVLPHALIPRYDFCEEGMGARELHKQSVIVRYLQISNLVGRGVPLAFYAPSFDNSCGVAPPDAAISSPKALLFGQGGDHTVV